MVSIIIPVYNAASTIERLLDSIVSQSYNDWEAICIDDGSTDDTPTVLDEYVSKHSSSNIRVFHIPNAGVSHARNIGINASRGEWITFADADDWLEHTAFEDYLSYAEETNADVVRAGYIRHLDGGLVRPVVVENNQCFTDLSQFFCHLERAKHYSWVWTMMIKRECIADIRFNERINYLEDHTFSYQCYFNCKRMAIIAKPTYHYVIHGNGSLSTCKNPYVLQEAAEQEYLLKTRMVDGKDVAVQQTVDDCYQYHLHSIVFLLYSNGYNYKERKKFSRMSRLIPTLKYKHEKVFFSLIPFVFKDVILKLLFIKVKSDANRR